MCYAFDAQPPDLPLALAGGGGGVDAESLVLTSADGARFAAHLAQPANPGGAGVVVLPDVRGLFRFYEELADRFAAAGIAAIAIDYFGRTAGLTARDEAFEFMPHVAQTRPETVAADVAAAIAHLRGLPEAPRAIVTVGFCFGGTHSFLQAASGQGLAGVVGFYGGLGGGRFGLPAPADRAGDFACPVLGLFGGDDPGIPAAAIARFDAALAAAGVVREIVTYPGAPHSFFDRRQEQFRDASADAWRRVLGFIEAHDRRPAGA